MVQGREQGRVQVTGDLLERAWQCNAEGWQQEVGRVGGGGSDAREGRKGDR